ncbi:TRAP transporter large permease subunit [Oscillibacter sp. MSJ-2]|uniref:TRAP transporter large permease subunit n=1 Tax=Dysosmobacter acutus TaxID=2841504 RepID=A0ABS6F775_9FIRM|nr:TRAP transporter large permease subunit [Dysosmobacter acutus]MBU5626129.1 TRAP transporter large permease subunit [Dysosmobacter acutus]
MEASLGAVLVLMLVMMIVMTSGLPVPFALGGTAILAVLVFWDPSGFISVSNGVWSTFIGDSYVAIPMFLLMANILERTGIADDLYEMMYNWMSGIRGGLAMATVVICAIFGAMCGGSGAATVTMGLIALPSMKKRGYDEKIAMGVILAGGVLGIIIPPSIPMVILSQYSRSISVGKLFFAGVIPGILCAIIYCIYIGVRCAINPNLCPAIPKEERPSWNEKVKSLSAVIAPAILIVAVLGSIYMGLATPVEAAGLGAGCSIIIALLRRKLTIKILNESLAKTLKLIGMILWILAAAAMLNTVLNVMGVNKLLQDAAMALPGGANTVMILMMLLNFVLGCLMDDYAVITLTAPIYLPLIEALGIDPLWFSLIFMLNLQMAYLTPPYGFNLFFLKSIVPKDVPVTRIYKAAIPFIALQLVALLICWNFPTLITWLPSKLI